MRRCAWWNRQRSCSRCCWCSWKSAMPSTAATSTEPTAGLTEVALQVCVALAMAIGLERLRIRTGSIVHNVGAILLTVFAGHRRMSRCRLRLLMTILPFGGRCRRRVLQPAAARLRPARGAGAACCPLRSPAAGTPPMPTPSRRPRCVLALTYVTLEIRRFYHGPVLATGADHRCRAIHLFDRVARLRRRAAARRRHLRSIAARAAGVRRRDRADDR